MNAITGPIAKCACQVDAGSPIFPLLVVVLFVFGFILVSNWLEKSSMKEKINMKYIRNILIVLALVVAVATVVVIKQRRQAIESTHAAVTVQIASLTGTPAQVQSLQQLKADPARTLPRLVDLGADKCVPCKMMAPILADFKKNHADKFTVQFIDVWENPDEGKKYNINIIPTQIFFAPDGKELFRHEGFFGKDDILATWKKFGFDFNGN